MCQFCLEHGEGRRWSLEARNYAADRVRQSRTFRDVIHWLTTETHPGNRSIARLRWLLKLPVMGRAISAAVQAKMKREHFGQVLPLSDVRRVFEMVDAVHCFPCVCRRCMTGKHDERY